MEFEIPMESDITTEGARPKPHKSRRDLSRDTLEHSDLGLLEEQMGLVEDDAKDTIMCIENLEEFVQGLEGDVLASMETFREYMKELHAMVNIKEQLEEKVASQAAEIAGLQAKVEGYGELKTKVLILEKVASHNGPSSREAPRFRISETKSFSGVRDAKKVENILWAMERYLKALKVMDKVEKVNTSSIYFTDDALLWWRHLCAEIEKGLCIIDSWEDLKRKIKS